MELLKRRDIANFIRVRSAHPGDDFAVGVDRAPMLQDRSNRQRIVLHRAELHLFPLRCQCGHVSSPISSGRMVHHAEARSHDNSPMAN